MGGNEPGVSKPETQTPATGYGGQSTTDHPTAAPHDHGPTAKDCFDHGKLGESGREVGDPRPWGSTLWTPAPPAVAAMTGSP